MMNALGRWSRFGVLAAICLCGALAQAADELPPEPRLKTLLGDTGAYISAPLHWRGEQWAYFTGTIATIAIAHHYDTHVRQHFASAAGGNAEGHDTQDWLPAAGLLGGTWAYGMFLENRTARGVAWDMTEAAGLSGAAALLLRYAAGRERPDQTTDANRWRKGGSSFPSLHVTATFALGTVFAESGGGSSLWFTRGLGYGLATLTAYERVRHNAHWLSDVVAGAALGTATGVFVTGRANHRDTASGMVVLPTDGGLMLAYQRSLDF